MSGGRRIVLIGGCARSGTTALVRLLNAHPDCMIGHERFFGPFRRGEIGPGHFERSRFLDIQPGDTHPGNDKQFAALGGGERFDRAGVIGDKYPRLFQLYGQVRVRLPGARVVFALRNPFSVAESHQVRFDDPNDNWERDPAAGLAEWNQSLASTRDALAAGMDIVVASYEPLFSGPAAAARLFARLGLDPARADWQALEAVFAQAGALRDKPVPRREEMRRMIGLTADFDLYRRLCTENCLFAETSQPDAQVV